MGVASLREPLGTLSPLTIGHADVEPHDILALKISHAVLRITAACTCSTLMPASLRITDCERCLESDFLDCPIGYLARTLLFQVRMFRGVTKLSGKDRVIREQVIGEDRNRFRRNKNRDNCARR